MARETKVGLLAGLAFIVCFAVILANRGQPQGSANYQSLFVGDEPSPEMPAGTVRAGAYEILNAPARTPRNANPPSLTLRQPPPSDGVTLHHEPDRAYRPQDPHDNHQAQGPDASGAELSWSTEPSAPARSADSMLSAVPREPNNKNTQNLDQYLNEQQGARLATSRIGQNPEPRTSSLNPSSPETSRAGSSLVHEHRNTGHSGVQYTVVSGDTLSSIVQRHYGSRSKRHIDAVLDANRSVLTNPDIVKVGMVLVLPAVTPDTTDAGSSTQHAGASANQSAGQKRLRDQSADPPDGFRWYQVRANDRYVTIARDELGDSSRWRELFELNKDKFPNPDKIRVGVRIKLPVNGDAGNGTRR
jgi:nucleoid-associated protein YgaU